ncbi:hypothetical protein GV791_24175 [Nocardia cyriacigeorgica]|uniref:Uncharacterized protein n=1 Tax=Nocardia cyriacigeorgica TaxID=135487 RepID=A0A6P1CSW9_9NOCA|nr:hypothetical protein [Nocardia cyriacigeorgica]MBF6084496.1 hypothetical protein [Nocardia cyriacigeorgica]MBF6290056.1 hypothetical protein [Nocardia cyriacigeorgica]NEW35641.1 hypothetical protein [Nocardia cyriacigeorgica]BDT84291.1 hypothetical protein FMUAM8_00550 [Nocardia cyriacigeorgica]
MSDDAPPRPLEGLLTEVREGRLSVNFGAGSPDAVRVNAEEFVYIDRDCEGFKLLIQELQAIAKDVADREKWDLGEGNPDLGSARTLVSRYRSKAMGAEDKNSVHEILDEHYRIVEDIQTLHREIAQRYLETDEAFASRYNELTATLPPPGPLTLPPGPNIFGG